MRVVWFALAFLALSFAVEPVFAQEEGAAAVRADRLVDAVAVQEAAIERADARVGDSGDAAVHADPCAHDAMIRARLPRTR